MKLWIDPQPVGGAAAELADLKPLYQQILFNRGLTRQPQVQSFFNPTQNSLPDPYSLPDMPAAVQRLQQAHQNEEHVVIYGDYDADGVTATALLTDGLAKMGLQVQHYIPNRFDHGYGVNTEAVQKFADDGIDLVITVDCGVRALEEIDLANSLGVEFIVTDHHHPGPDLPAAAAVVNPRLLAEEDQFRDYSGVGIAYFLLKAFGQEMGQEDLSETYLDLVALGTVADLAPLINQNRTLVARGLLRLNDHPRPGIEALIQSSGFKAGSINTNSIGFGLAPRLNAAGRLDSAESAFRLLMADDVNSALPLASSLERVNQERRRLTEQATKLAQSKIEESAEIPYLIFTMDETFNEGVVGLAASRLVDEYYRPAVVAVAEEKECRGSARSIPEFHITEAFEQCSDLLDRFGGHAAAAGFETSLEKVPALIDRLAEISKQFLMDQELSPKLPLDAYVGFNQVDEELMAFLDRLEPSGMENPRPIFATKNVQVVSKRAVGANKSHLKLALTDGSRYFDCIAFRMGSQIDQIPARIDVAYRPEWNDYMGVRSLQLNVEDFRPRE